MGKKGIIKDNKMKNKITNKSVRLPIHISPITYNLVIKPDLESFTFSGNETIKIKVDKEVKEITIHSKNIEIETAKYKNGKTICN